ncbi:arginine deiminase [Companilactobacillus halodurans]|uniref:Arginine deiminase n=1 Tax=Companilactobacillus halodurans TaxID=2584183 RepID=A0A5P0ZN15_9LACO|nr:arginine deiminase [Companilactobacillus halodurans]MQS75576.1 arginine deiminase [Companilactobacillus halodurans]MQS96290.1 arginine deiminase [Companilactobacillus halodurans]
MTMPIHVTSEIGKLDVVMLKRPDHEVENITPDTMPRLLFDDIPYLPIAQKEHDHFAQILRDNGTEVLYLENLAAEAIDAGNIKEAFVEKMLRESDYAQGADHDALKEYLMSLDTKAMVNQLMIGIRKSDIDFIPTDLVSAAEDNDYPFYLDPMPNLYFTRDPAASIGDGLSINHMTYPARQRESMFMEVIIKYHPRFANKGLHIWRDRNHTHRIEGGDELVLSDHVLAIGVSQRTSATAIQDISRNLFKDSNYDTVIAIKIPHNHAMMHLDTVFTMINYDQFTVHPGILGEGGKIDTWTIHPGKDNELTFEHNQDLKAVLKKELGLDDLDLIPTGNADPIIAPREQWNDGSNTLAIAPGVVVTYDRNYVSNEILRKHGLKVLETVSSELSRGRGGPRCMSMPLVREDLKK